MRNSFSAVIVILTVVLASGCQAQPSEEDLKATSTRVAAQVFATQTASVPTPTPTPKHSATPTLTPTPTPSPAVIGEWDNLQIGSLCLHVEQTFPQFEEDFTLPVETELVSLFQLMNIQVSEDRNSCEATLSIGLEGRVFAKSYQGSGGGGSSKCYTGSDFEGYLRLTHREREAIDVPIDESYYPTLLMGSCSEDPTTKVNWHRTWVHAVLEAMVEVWGAPAAVAGLKMDGADYHRAAIELVKRLGPEAVEAVPLLTTFLEEKTGGVGYIHVAEALGSIGPASMPAVPILIEYLEKEAESTSPVAFDWVYNNALEQITGVRVKDYSQWSTWWEQNEGQLENGP